MDKQTKNLCLLLMKNLRSALLIFGILSSFELLALPCTDSCPYLLVEGGGSYPLKTHFNPPPPWDPSPEGYSKKLRKSEMLGGGIGFELCSFLAAELKIDHRNSFKYKKFQSSTQLQGNKIRSFELKNTTVMADFLFYGSGILDSCLKRCDSFTIDPYVNIGLGLAYNSIDNFRSLQITTGKVFSMMLPYTKKSFAYQLGIGFDVCLCDMFSIGLGYRFLETTKLRSNRFIIDNPDSPLVTSGIVAPVWKGKFKTNEFFLRLKIPI